MRDLIRNYKRILAGKNRESETEDEESQPLMNSSSSSNHSFGTAGRSSLFRDESCSETTETEDEGDKKNLNKNYDNSSRLKINQYLNRILFPPNFDPPELDVYTSTENIYENLGRYAKINGVLKENPLSISIQSDVVKSESSSESFDPVDYIKEKHTHSSIVTIFAIWNTTMGSSLLAMSWGLQKSGLFPGIIINIAIAALCLYTCYLLLSINEKHGIPGQNIEVPGLCRMLLGRWAEILAKIFSVVVLTGSNIVYWILMSNFLYNSVRFLYSIFALKETEPYENATVICPKQVFININDSSLISIPVNISDVVVPTDFEKYWDLYSTVPVILGLVLFPILNFKSATFFTKFNSLGTISVAYLLIFVAVKSSNWGVNIQNWGVEFQLKPTFCALSGMLSLSYFIHNIIVSIMKNNRHQEYNGRDLTIAFSLITFTYLFIGVVFYVCFPLEKSCIEDNIFNNFSKSDTMTIIARILLMFQLLTVFPLISFMLRNDILNNISMISKNYGNFTYGRVIILNGIIVSICILFACFLPRIGTLIRYTGAMSGLVYIFMLPSLLKMASLNKERNLSVFKFIFYGSIIIIGIVNLLSQFFIRDA